MDAILPIAGAIALLALAALILYFITVLREAKVVLANVGTTVNDLSTNLNEQIRNVDQVVKNVGALTDNVVSVVDDATGVIHEAQRIIVSIMELEQHIQKSIQVPIVETVGILAALGKGIRNVRVKLAEAIGGDTGLAVAGLDEDEMPTSVPRRMNGRAERTFADDAAPTARESAGRVPDLETA